MLQTPIDTAAKSSELSDRPKRRRFIVQDKLRILPEADEAAETDWRGRHYGCRKLHALHKLIPEPVFGIIKSVVDLRQFLLGGLDRIRSEWSLLTIL